MENVGKSGSELFPILKLFTLTQLPGDKLWRQVDCFAKQIWANARFELIGFSHGSR